MRTRWTPEMDAALQELYPALLTRECAARMNERFGTQLTPDGVRDRAGVLLLTHEAPPGYYTQAEVASMFGIKRATLKAQVTRGAVRAKRMGRRMLIPTEELARLERWYLAKAPWPAMTGEEACNALSFSRANLRLLIKKGRLTAVKVGREWWVKRDEVERALIYLKQTGEDRVAWRKLKAG